MADQGISCEDFAEVTQYWSELVYRYNFRRALGYINSHFSWPCGSLVDKYSEFECHCLAHHLRRVQHARSLFWLVCFFRAASLLAAADSFALSEAFFVAAFFGVTVRFSMAIFLPMAISGMLNDICSSLEV